MTARVLIVPGIGDSPALHWQSLWQESEPGIYSRIALSQSEWDKPGRERWVAAIEEAVGQLGPDLIMVAHSLGCLAVAHWASSASVRIRGSLLVSPPDPMGPTFPSEAKDFGPVPLVRLPFPTIVVASSDDPYLSIAFARRCAEKWGSRLCEAGPRGHLSASDNLGEWPLGKALLAELRLGA
jgi:predicted alpha/beta hydrolase family esterase